MTVWINSPGGNVFAAAEIYTMLCEHKGRITVKIDAIAASAASVIAMAGDRVLMSPVAMLMIHDPMTIAMGNAKDMEKAISTLNEVKASIINAYQKKTGLSRNRISKLMEDETWMNAKKAVELGFADEVLFTKTGNATTEEPGEEKNDVEEREVEAGWQPYSTKAMGQRVLNRLVSAPELPAVTDEADGGAGREEEAVEQEEAGVDDTEPQEDATSKADTAVEDKSEPPARKTGGGEPDEDAGDDDDTDKDDGQDGDDDPDGVPDKDDEPEGDPDDPDEKKPTKPSNSGPQPPVIGMDGKTKDGSMPYELLKR